METTLHVAIKLLLAVLCAVGLALKGAQTLEALAGGATQDIASTQFLDKSGFLDLLLEPLLKAVIALFAVFVGMDCHKCGDFTGSNWALQGDFTHNLT